MDGARMTITVPVAVGARLGARAVRMDVSTTVVLERLLDAADRAEFTEVVAEESARWSTLLHRLA